ncbi:uncharacterized protein [Haliotis asinina]
MPVSFVQFDFVLGGFSHLLVIFICIGLSSSASRPDFFCPEVVDLHSQALLNCSVSHTDTTVKYEGPQGLDAPQCDLAQGRCTKFGAYSASIVYHNNTVLMINNVSQSMAGEWRCKDDATALSSSCNLQISKTPTCSIKSDVKTDVVAVGGEASFNISIISYYCSGVFNFTLQTGNISQTLYTAVDSHGTKAVTVSFNVTESHYGDVRLIFACHSYLRSVPCAGITQLLKSASSSRFTFSHGTILILCIISITNPMFPGDY